MPLPLIITALAGMFLGSQVDRAVDNATTPAAGGSGFRLPLYAQAAIVLAAGAAAYVITKKITK